MVPLFLFFCKNHAPVVTRWFGARCFGFLVSPYERDCYLGVPRFESQSTNSNHQLTISWVLVLWMVNQPPLTYSSPRNEALIRAYEPLVSLNRVLLNHELKSIKIRFPLKVPPIRTREHPRTREPLLLRWVPLHGVCLRKDGPNPRFLGGFPTPAERWKTIATLPERNLKMDAGPSKEHFIFQLLIFRCFVRFRGFLDTSSGGKDDR